MKFDLTDDRLSVRVGQEALVYRELLQIALAQHHATLDAQRKLDARYARLLEDFRALQSDEKSVDSPKG